MWWLHIRTNFVGNSLRDIALLFVLAVLTWGCSGPEHEPTGAYEEPNLPTAEISVVHRYNDYQNGWFTTDYTSTVVLKVDGVRGQIDPAGQYLNHHVQPGEHQALVLIERGEGGGRDTNLIPDLIRSISFSTQAGKSYDVFARRINDVTCCPHSIELLDLWIWVEDETGRIVGGEKHPDD